MHDIAIRITELSKSFSIQHQVGHRATNLGEALANKLRRPFQRAQHEEFWALKDIELTVKKGEVVGIIGRNGAGKSTLLKILSRITEPTSGRIELFGRVGSLLEVGTGFHPELTGRENIFLNGAILGMRKHEIRKQFDAIVDFSGVEKFIDTPVKRYSSGMYVRLAFAVAAHLNPDILIVDEVLAVGDAEFQKKCLGKMQDIASKNGRTVLFVSHNMSAVQSLCTHGVVLERGRVKVSGQIGTCIDAYQAYSVPGGRKILEKGRSHKAGFSLQKLTVNDSELDEINLNPDSTELEIYAEGVTEDSICLDIELFLNDAYGTRVGQASPTRQNGNLLEVPPGKFCLRTKVQLPNLNRGSFQLHVMINDPLSECFWDCADGVRIHSHGSPMRNGSVLEATSSGALLLNSSTGYV